MKRKPRDGRGGPRPGAGRKPLPVQEKRRNRVVLNLLDEEYDALVGAAGDELPSTYARRVVVAHLVRRRRTK